MEQTLTLNETARRLGVSRHKVWLLVKDGTLPARQNPLDKREKLIPLSAVEQLAAQGKPAERPKPRTFDMINDPTLQSTDLEDYMREHWHPETPDSVHPWPRAIGAADLGVQSDTGEEWLEGHRHSE